MKIKRIKRLVESLNESELKQLNILLEKEYRPHTGNMFLDSPLFSKEEKDYYSLKDEQIRKKGGLWNEEIVKPGMSIKVRDLMKKDGWLQGKILGFDGGRIMYVGFEDDTYTMIDIYLKKEGEDYIIEF